MSWFKNAMADMAARKGARKLKTTITRKTEDGNVTVTVKGVVATDAETLSEKAAELGVTVAGKGGSYGAAEGSTRMLRSASSSSATPTATRTRKR
jgi:hypothetical protein